MQSAWIFLQPSQWQFKTKEIFKFYDRFPFKTQEGRDIHVYPTI
jgi:hypothetical protein